MMESPFGANVWLSNLSECLNWDNFIKEFWDQLVEAQISEVNVTTTHNAHVHCAKKENVHWN